MRNKVDVLQRIFLRIILKVTKLDKIKNDDVYKNVKPAHGVNQ